MPFFAISQVNRLGYPTVKNFNAVTYKASEQNWGIVQDKRGIIYIANNAGVLEYDGTNWRMIAIPNNSAARSIALDEKGRVYVGSIGEFGYLEPDEIGSMQYVSLLNKVDTAYHEFAEVWKTYAYGNKVHFSTRLGFYTYNSDLDEVETYRYSRTFRESFHPLFTFVIGQDIYLGAFSKGLMKFKDGNFESVVNGEFFIRKNIFAILKYDDDNLMICTNDSGVFLYNLNDHTLDADFFKKETQELLIDSYLFNAVKLPDNKFGFATNEGVIVADRKGNIEYIINQQTGLQDQTVYAIYHNSSIKNGPLWIALDNGLSYANIFDPIMQFSEIYGLKGLLVDVTNFNNTIVVSTTAGVFYLETYIDKPSTFISIDDIKMSAWSLDVFVHPVTKKERLIVATSGEVYEVNNQFKVNSITKQLGDITHNAFEVKVSEKYPERIYLGLTGGLDVIELVGNTWKLLDFRDQHNYSIKGIVEDDNGDIWVASHTKGYAKFGFSKSKYNPTVELYNSENGLPENLTYLKLKKYNKEILFPTSQGVFLFNEKENNFYIDNRFSDINSRKEAGYFAIAEDKNSNLLVSRYIGQQEGWIEKYILQNDGSFKMITHAFKPMPPLWCDAIFVDENNVVWFGISNILFSYDNNLKKNYQEQFNTIIRKVNTLGDSLIFAGTNYNVNKYGIRETAFIQPDNLKPVLSYKFNNLEFYFSAPLFDNQDKIEYSYILEGFDNWSRWTTETKAVYSYIKVGSYTFKVKARNAYGQETEPATFQITVLPPWYETIYAYISYVIILVLIVYGLVVLNTRRLKREKEILEGIVRERTAEVVKQKDEIELQRDKIAKQNENITNSIAYAKRIQTAALPPSDFIDQLIEDRFILFMPRDIVSGDFYWIGKMGEKVVVAAADCTGHGVPGGFMSMLGIAYLNQIVSSGQEYTAGQILDQLRDQVMKSLRQKDEASESRDGMDIALYVFDKEKSKIQFAGANNPLYLIRNNELIEIECDKMPIGIHRRADRNFVNQEVDVIKGDMLYSFSDGYKDQFGGPEGRKFMSKNFKELLVNVNQKPCSEQRDILEKAIIDWTGHHERIDDIIVMGVRI